MAKIILTEEQLQKVIKQRIEEQNFLNIPAANAANLLRTSPYAPSKPAAPNAAAVAATNAPLMKPGESPEDYFRNPDGTIKVTDLEPVTVSAKRTKPAAAPTPQAPVNAPTPAAPTSPTAPAPTTSVASGPTSPEAQQKPVPQQAPQQQASTTPQMSGEQFHEMLMQKGLINGFTDMDGYENRRIVYKGAPLSPEQVTLLTNYLVSKGYGKRFSQVGDKRYGQKYVWVKGGSAPIPSDMSV